MFIFWLQWTKTKLNLYMKLIVVFFLLLMTAWACTGGGVASVAQLQREVLDSACDEELRKDLENRINRQKPHLTEAQMIQSLKNMKQDIRCNPAASY